ncbi:unnamed protein product [Didymodactylos carnosus]|uniref:F-box domain-containing protein n=1 Tax=Didymodactylos carnosus TaxID=1234261 RepID=A0A814BRQ7_9BILA|nr:unnamed protein product [Didymodactylos carnosus]CAF0929883.1 unnamed protein product [Didymodactylos carnosus]CAF3634791.1 unnamed protein product [Didymodactylos carnosus]CAF3707987.1 unnamed protein product [Didymodactylos carnosus]
MSTFESSLPNEVIFNIFGYLNSTDVFLSFINLNNRLNCLLEYYFNTVDLTKIWHKTFKCYINILLPTIGVWVKNLKLGGEQTYYQLDILSLCPNLQTVSIVKVRLNDIESHLELFQRLSELKLSLILPDDDDEYPQTSKEFRHINLCKYLFCRNSSLEKLELNWLFINKHIRPCKLQELIITLNYFSDLFILFNNLPNIRSIQVNFLNDDCHKSDIKHYVYKNLAKKIHHLTDFSLKSCHPFENDTFISNLIRHLPSGLKRLSLEISFRQRTNFIDGNYVKREFLSKFLQLNTLYYSVFVELDNHILVDEIVVSFSSDYWLKRNWLIECHYNENQKCFCLNSLPFSSSPLSGMSNGFLERKCNGRSVNINDPYFYQHIRVLNMYSPLSVPLFKLLNKTLKNVCVLNINRLEDDTDETNPWLHDDDNVNDNEYQFKTIQSLCFNSDAKLDENEWNIFRKRLLLSVPNVKILKINYQTILHLTNNFKDIRFYPIFKNIIELILFEINTKHLEHIFQYFTNIHYLTLIDLSLRTKSFKLDDILEIFRSITHLVYLDVPFDNENMYHTVESVQEKLNFYYHDFYIQFSKKNCYNYSNRQRIQLWK